MRCRRGGWFAYYGGCAGLGAELATKKADYKRSARVEASDGRILYALKCIFDPTISEL